MREPGFERLMQNLWKTVHATEAEVEHQRSVERSARSHSREPSFSEHRVREGDTTLGNRDTAQMNDISREELDAKLEATQAKIDARLAGFESAVRETLSAVRQDSAESRGELKLIHAQLGDLQHIKRSIWGAAAATVIGVSGIIASIVGFGVASFDSGRETSQLVESAKQQTQATQKLLEQMQSQSKALTPSAASPSNPK